jgi:hypothetical protein
MQIARPGTLEVDPGTEDGFLFGHSGMIELADFRCIQVLHVLKFLHFVVHFLLFPDVPRLMPVHIALGADEDIAQSPDGQNGRYNGHHDDHFHDLSSHKGEGRLFRPKECCLSSPVFHVCPLGAQKIVQGFLFQGAKEHQNFLQGFARCRAFLVFFGLVELLAGDKTLLHKLQGDPGEEGLRLWEPCWEVPVLLPHVGA